MQKINLKTKKKNSLDFFIKSDIFSFRRDCFYEIWNEDKFNEKILLKNFCKDNISHSLDVVFRGIHYQLNTFARIKLI